jgi:hypothetical protein
LITLGVNGDFTANAGCQHHHTHDAFGIDSALTFGHPNFTWKTTRQLCQFGGSTSV